MTNVHLIEERHDFNDIKDKAGMTVPEFENYLIENDIFTKEEI